MKITDKQKQKAINKAKELASSADSQTIDEATKKVDSYKKEGALKKVWDNIKLLTELIKNPYMAGSALFTAIGAILYLVLPVDVIPDFIPAIGLLDDVAVILALFPVVINMIKKDPKKVLDIVDSLPQEVKKTASVALGVVGGAAIGGIAGAKVADAIKDVKLGQLYEDAFGPETLVKDAIDISKNELVKKAHELIQNKVEDKIKDSFIKKYRRSLEVVCLYLLSILFSLSPSKSSPYFASVCLLLSWGYVLFNCVRSLIKAFPYFVEVVKQKSVYLGIKKRIEEQYALVLVGERVLSKFGIEPTEDEMKSLAKKYVVLLKRQIIYYVLGFCFITLAFYLFKHILFSMNVSGTTFQVAFYPIFKLLNKQF